MDYIKVLSSGINHSSLPEKYVRPESERPNLSQVSECQNVPLIDLAHPDRSFKEVVSEYCIEVRSLGMRLEEAISESLGLEKHYITQVLGEQGQHMAINFYPPCPEPELTYGLPAHTDPNALTILLQDSKVSGLQVLIDGTWLSVKPHPDAFVVNIGDQLQGRGRIIDTISEIQERHDAVKDLERNLRELHQVFMDMAVSVEHQGEQLNDIEAQVLRANSYVRGGTTQLQTARKHQKNTRKWTCYAIILLLIIILIVILSLKPWNWK